MRAQSSIETLIILAVGLFILTVFMGIIFDQITVQQMVQQQQTALQSMRILANEVDNIYFLGTGSKKEVKIFIPEMVDLSKSIIENKNIIFSIADQNFYVTTKAFVRGAWPNVTGSHIFVIESFGDFVSISTTSLSFSPIQINESLNQNSSRQIELIVSNLQNANSSYNFSIDFSGTEISSPQDGNIFNFGSSGSEADSNTIIINLVCSNNSVGNYSATLNFTSSIVNVTYPVNLSCLSGQQRLTIYPSQKSLSLIPNRVYSESFLVCNNSKTNYSNITFSIDGNVRQIAFGSLEKNIPANTCKNLNLNIFSQESGNYNGEIIISGSGIDVIANLIVDLSGPFIYFVSPTPTDNDTIYNDYFDLNVFSSGLTNISTFIDFNNSLVGWWRMDDIDGTTVIDYLGDHNGTIIGGAGQVDGKFGKALNFDGVDDYISIVDSDDSKYTGPITICVWANITVSSGAVQFVGKHLSNGASQNPFDFRTSDAGKLALVRANTSHKEWQGPYTIKNSWNHYCVSSTLIDVAPVFYVNGVATTGILIGAPGTGVPTGSGANIRIGMRADGYGKMKGGVDDVMIFNRILDEDEVQALYASTSPKYLDINYTDLGAGEYSFTAFVQDTRGEVVLTETRTIELILPSIDLNIIYPTTDIDAMYYTSFDVNAEVCCYDANCGDIEVSLDPMSGCDPANGECGSCGNLFWDIPYYWEWYDNGEYGKECYSYESGYYYLVGDEYDWICTMFGGDCMMVDYYDGYGYWDIYCPSYVTNGGPVSESDCYCEAWGSVCPDPSEYYYYIDFSNDFFATEPVVLKEGLVSTIVDDIPFYTTQDNPFSTNLDKDECEIISWPVTATGSVGSTHTFFVYGEKVGKTSINDTTSEWLVTITPP